MTSSDEVERLLADWQAACRAHDVLAILPLPDSRPLVQEVAARVLDAANIPDAVIRGLAAGLAAVDWHASGEVLQLQIGLLMEVVAEDSRADHRRAAHTHTVLSAAAAGVAVEAWRVKAEVDELTGLRNRAGWQRDFAKLEAEQRPVAYASIDLDGLKAINDGQGHAAGDELLRSFARRLEVAVNGAGGASYRYGGDEFSAVLPIDVAELAPVMERLAAAEGVPAFSFGVALWPDDDADLTSAVSMADRRMYVQKQARKSVSGSAASERELPESENAPHDGNVP